MSKDKKKKIIIYIENKGRGKASVADSFVSVREYPNKKDGKQAVGVYATKVEMFEDHLDAFKGMLKVHHPHQLNILSEEEYKMAKKESAESGQKKLSPDEQMEKEFFESAINGGDDEILAYLDAYPGKKGKHYAEIQERSDYLDTKAKNTKKAYMSFLKDYPNGRYSQEVNTLLGTNR